MSPKKTKNGGFKDYSNGKLSTSMISKRNKEQISHSNGFVNNSAFPISIENIIKGRLFIL